MRYLRILFLLLLVGLISHAGQAQYKPIVFGVRFAPNLGWMKSDLENYDKQGMEPGYSWGFFGDFFLMENYAIQTGFNILNISGGLQYPHALNLNGDTVPTFGTLTRIYKFRYVEVPLVFKLHIDATEKSRFFGKIGLGTGFLLKAKAEDGFEYDGGNIDDNPDIKDDIRQVRSALILGAGYQYAFKGSTSLLIEFTYNDGFIDVLKGANVADPSVDHMANNRFIELGVGIIF